MSFKANPISLRLPQQTPTINNFLNHTYFIKNNLLLFELIKNYCQTQKIKFVNIQTCFETTFLVIWVTYYDFLFESTRLKSFKKRMAKDTYMQLSNIMVSCREASRNSYFISAQLKNSMLNFKLKKKIELLTQFETFIKFKNIKWSFKFTNRLLNKKILNHLSFFKRDPNFKDAVCIVNLTTYCKRSLILSDYLSDELCKVNIKKTKQRSVILLLYRLILAFLNIRINIFGVKLQISGRIDGRRRKKTIRKLFGSMPLQTLSANIDYNLSQSYNAYGILSVSVWLHYY